MSSYKDQWFNEYERQLNEHEDRLGRPLSQKEEEYLAEKARINVNTSILDAADILRKQEKGE
jgi:hypothetical protein